MGVVVVEELICDFCGKRINDPSDAWRGPLELRVKGAKGISRRVGIVLHSACRDRLTRHATKP